MCGKIKESCQRDKIVINKLITRVSHCPETVLVTVLRPIYGCLTIKLLHTTFMLNNLIE